ncbi:membrane protein [Agreia bicolorata]|uniref:Membrane protein n=2 Tax=Agreia bicolorata TaxID=110935 RepID=A0ABR5CCD1_9MICO|nr:membrane protein [Agreia bicolorata]
MYLGGVAQIALGILTLFIRYIPDAPTGDIGLLVSLFGAGMILFGLFVIALASGVARGSHASRVSATVVLLLTLVLALVDLVVAGDGDWSGVAVQLVSSTAVILPLWTGAGRRYFAPR